MAHTFVHVNWAYGRRSTMYQGHSVFPMALIPDMCELITPELSARCVDFEWDQGVTPGYAKVKTSAPIRKPSTQPRTTSSLGWTRNQTMHMFHDPHNYLDFSGKEHVIVYQVYHIVNCMLPYTGQNKDM